jgi:hypothetical protein
MTVGPAAPGIVDFTVKEIENLRGHKLKGPTETEEKATSAVERRFPQNQLFIKNRQKKKKKEQPSLIERRRMKQKNYFRFSGDSFPVEVTHFIHSPTQFASYFRVFFRFCGREVAMFSKQKNLTSDATVTQTF